MLNPDIFRKLLMGLVCSTWPLALSGCGSETTPYVPKSEYTPESLADELAFRYERMNPISKPKPIVGRKNREPAGTAEKVEKKAKEDTKTQQAVTLEDLVDEVVEKVRNLPEAKPEEVLRKVADLVEKNPKIKEADRRLMADRLVQSK